MRLLVELTYGRCQCPDCRLDRLQWRWILGHADRGASWRQSVLHLLSGIRQHLMR